MTKIFQKNIGVLICGGNNDITRMAEIKERALLYSKLNIILLLNFLKEKGLLENLSTTY
ncbi:MAG: hypothetical protein CM15mP102_06300 [Flavobacteriales bacterium]|nr:MAG: hypothetical protein CM15mP102_06300 [Flavobacteriales bacterium]